MSLRSLSLVPSALALFALVGCASATTEDPPASAEALHASAHGTMCEGLGTNEPTLFEVQGSKLTMTRRGTDPQVGFQIADPAPGFSGYRFKPTTSGSGLTIWLSADRTKAEMHEDNVGPHWESSCHPATAAELSVDACAIVLKDFGYGDRPANVTKTSGTEYRIESKVQAGDFVWTADSKGTGFTCKVDFATIAPVSCPAVVYDAIGQKARDDGSSAGSPYVKSEGGTSWSGGIHDPESGEFSYDIKTDSTADHCEIVSIVSTGDR